MLLRTRMILWKEFVQIFRDPRLLVVVIGLPVVMLMLYGYAFNLDVKHVRMAVYDQDRSSASREVIGAFSRSGYFDVVEYVNGPDAMTEAINTGRAKVALVIPIRYAGDLAAGRKASLQLIIDGSDSTVATTAIGYATAILQQYTAQVTLAVLQRAGAGHAFAPVENRPRFWYNPELNSTFFLIPGLIAVILSMLAALLTSVTIARERERGTIESLIVSPVTPIELMLGKLIPYVLIAFCDVLLVMAVSTFVFHVPLVGSPALVLLLSSIFLLAALGIGLFISVTAKSQQLAMTMAMMTTQLPAVFLSGFVFPVSSMPKQLQWLTAIVPATHFIKILRGIFLKGNGLLQVWQPALVLLCIGVGVLALSALRFKKRL